MLPSQPSQHPTREDACRPSPGEAPELPGAARRAQVPAAGKRPGQQQATGWLSLTLQLQGLARGELPQLAVRQGELVPLELQRHWGLWLGDPALRPRQGSQLGYFDHLPTCRNAEEDGIKTSGRTLQLLY